MNSLPAQRILLLLGGDRHRPDTPADSATRQGRDGVRVVAAARVLGVVLMGMQTFWASRSTGRSASWPPTSRRPAAGRWNRLGRRRSPALVVMIALLIQWRRSDQRTAERLDRAADRDDDAELAAYDAMLAELAPRQPVGQLADRARSSVGLIHTQGAATKRTSPDTRPSVPLDRAGCDGAGQLPYALMSGPVAAAPSQPNAVRHVPSWNSTLPSASSLQGGQEPAERRRGQQPPVSEERSAR